MVPPRIPVGTVWAAAGWAAPIAAHTTSVGNSVTFNKRFIRLISRLISGRGGDWGSPLWRRCRSIQYGPVLLTFAFAGPGDLVAGLVNRVGKAGTAELDFDLPSDLERIRIARRPANQVVVAHLVVDLLLEKKKKTGCWT